MNSGDYYSNFIGSSTANFAFGCFIALLLWIKRRVKISKCKTNCHWFECESQLEDLKHVKAEVSTQRGILENVLDLLDAGSRISRRPPPIVIPRRTSPSNGTRPSSV